MWLKNNIKLIIIYIVAIIPFLKWLTNGTFVAGDLKYYPTGYYDKLLDLFAWISYSGYGGQNDVLSRFYKDIIGFSISSFFSLDSNAGNIIMLYVPYLLSGFLAVYFLVKYLKANDWFIISFIVFAYVFNTYFLASNSQGHFLLPISFNFGLVSLFCLLIKSKNLTINTIIVSLLVLIVSATFDFRFAYLFFIINSIYILYLKRFSKYIFLYFFIFVLTQLYWVYPFLYSYDQSYTIGRPLFGGQFWGLMNALVGYHPFWNEGNLVNWFHSNSIPFVQLFLMVLVLYIGLIKIKNKVYVTWFLFYLVFVFLAKLDNEPFSHIYGFLYQYLPGFNAFRESSKFYPFVTISFIVIIGIYYQEVKNKNLLKLVIMLLILSTMPSYFGVLSEKAGEIYKKEYIPTNYNSKEFLSLTGNLVWFPSKPTFAHNNIDAKHLSWAGHLKKDSKEFQLSKSEIDIYNLDYLIVPGDLPFDFDYSLYGTTKDFIKNNVENKLLNNKYYDDGYMSVYRLREKYTPDFRIESPLSFIRMNSSYYGLDLVLGRKIENMKFLQAFHPQWKLYLEPFSLLDCNSGSRSYSGTVDIPNGLTSSGTIYFVKSRDDYEKIALTHTGLTVSQLGELNPDIDPLDLQIGMVLKISQPTPIYQTESYNIRDCTADIQPSFSIIDGITKLWEKPIFDDTHMIIYDYANQWTINPEYIKANYSREYYRINPDGTMDVRLTMYFRPQSYFYLGLIISGLTLFACISYLVVSGVRGRRKGTGEGKKVDFSR